MTVWIVERVEMHEGNDILAVYSTEDKAKLLADTMNARKDYADYVVTSWDVDAKPKEDWAA